jgi:hypothetical protein
MLSPRDSWAGTEVVEKERCILDVSAVSTGRLLYSAEANCPTTGEFAGRGFRRTGDALAGCAGWDRNALND